MKDKKCKITKVIINDFRQLKHLEYEVSNLLTRIEGTNELGKSNSLSALMWLFTGTLYTDKWGSGENNIDSIFPVDGIRGTTPEVIIEVSDNEGGKMTFGKKYVTTYSRDGLKVTGHTTEYYVNGAKCDSATQFISDLYAKFNFKPSLRTAAISEVRLFIDPLYALCKLDTKQLRALFVDLGCDVSNEELFNAGYEDLRPVAESNNGKWDLARKNYKSKIKSIEDAIRATSINIAKLGEVEFDETELITKENELKSVYEERANVKANNINPEALKVEQEIKALELSISSKNRNYKSRIDDEIKQLKLKKENLEYELHHNMDAQAAPIKEKINTIKNDIKTYEAAIKSYRLTITHNEKLMEQYVTLGKANQDEKSKLAIKLADVQASQFDGMLTCPVCGCEFPLHENDVTDFEAHKKEEIEKLNTQIRECDTKHKMYNTEFMDAKKMVDDAKREAENATQLIQDLNAQLETFNNQLIAIESQEIDLSEVNEIDNKIASLLYGEMPQDDDAVILQNLKNQLALINEESSEIISEAIKEYDIKINELNNEIQTLRESRSKHNSLIEYKAQLEALQVDLNNTEATYQRINALVHTMISLINEKATAKTGFNVVMLEENISNDSFKEVCYVTVDGVPFEYINTANKNLYGIRFIETLKRILGDNDFPILIDKLEGIDLEKTNMNEFTNEQVFATRVTHDQVITIR